MTGLCQVQEMDQLKTPSLEDSCKMSVHRQESTRKFTLKVVIVL